EAVAGPAVDVVAEDVTSRSGALHAARTRVRRAMEPILIAASLATSGHHGARPAGMATTVEITTGRLEGTREDGVLVFRGIPFARPRLGPGRLEPPTAVEPWPEVRDATRFGPAAVQTRDLIGPSVGFDQPESAEDCLTLNVWTPGADDARRPVLVW